VQVREIGLERLEFAPPPGNAVTATRDRTYDRVITLRRNGSGYQLANQSETSGPAGWWELWAKIVARGLLVAGAAVLLAGLWVVRRRRPAVAGDAPVPGSQPASEVPPVPIAPDRNTITCFGGLRVTVHGEDLTSMLLARPVVAFIWVYLLAHEIRRPDARIPRAGLAEEVFPGLPSQTQRDRLRDRLRDIRTALPPILSECIVQTGEAVGFDAGGWSVDAIDLVRLAQLSRTAPPGDIPGGWASVERQWSGEFIPEWEDLERITEGRGTSHELIGEIRTSLEGALVDTLNVGIGQLLVLGDTGAAIRIAERARALRPDREDVRNNLARAYSQAGRHQAAAETEGL
jgi:Tetratricopeptide repeat